MSSAQASASAPALRGGHGEPMIEVSDLRKFYGDFEALKGISFSVGRGEIVGFLGPNGAGKTTTMKILTGYISATSGNFRVAGFDGFADSLAVRRNIGYLPENAPLYPDMGVVDYLRFVCRIRQIPKATRKQRIDRMLDLCGLTTMIKKDIGHLSKGYRQRVGLAQAMIHDPDILILDEPTSGLDPNQIVEIRKLIKDLGRDHTIILSTHNLPEVRMTCSRMIIISDGRKVADGTADELERQDTDATQLLVSVRASGGADAAAVRGGLASVSGVAQVSAEASTPSELRFRVQTRQGADPAAAIFTWAAESGWVLTELRRDVMDLEKVFHKLTQY